jgi:TRAP-type mannitol/chloroaromatic compound transport system permease small subunit
MKPTRWIDRLNRGIGRGASWLVLLMVLIGAGNAVARYLGRFVGMNLSSNAYLEAQWYLFSLVFLLGAAYTLQRDDHVRVDVLYSRLSRRGRAWIDTVGTVVFLIPFCLFCLWVSWPSIRNSWQVLEGSPDPGGLPRYPIKTVILIAFVLLILQGISILVDRIRLLRGGEEAPPQESSRSPGA